MRKLLVFGAVIAVMGLGMAPAAGAATDLVCVTTVSSGTYVNVTVPAGATCVLEEDVVIQGDLYGAGAANVIVSGATIGGDVRIEQSTGSLVLLNADTTIEGNLDLIGNDVANIVLAGSCASGGIEVGGNVTVSGNAAPAVAVNCSTLAGNVMVAGNTAVDVIQVDGNSIAGNLTLRRNVATGADGYIETGADLTAFDGPDGGPTGGNITFERNEAPALYVFSTETPANVTVVKNTSSLLFVGDLTIGKNLTCSRNDVAPTSFGDDFPNTVAGKANCAGVTISP